MHTVWQNTENGLIPADANAEKVRSRLKIGAYLRMDEPAAVRSPEQLRLYWALMTVAHNNQSVYATKEDLSDAVKCELGYCYTVTRPNGDKIQHPKSIALGNMPTAQFNVFFNAALDILSRTLGVTLDSLRMEAADSTLPAYIRNAEIAP